MIIEDYVSFEIAKLLKEKEFDEKVISFYPPGDIQRPTLQMAMKWLRERNWFICIIPLAFYCGEKAVKFGYNIWADDNLEVDEFSTPKFNTYEEACEAAIKYCLENLI